LRRASISRLMVVKARFWAIRASAARPDTASTARS
jgi:hypothetical protein